MTDQVLRVINRLADDVGTPRAQLVKSLANAGEWAKLQELRCNPLDYDDAEAYWRDNLLTEILRKCDLPTTVDKEAAAVATFFACEKDCATTNARLSRYLPSKLFVEPEDMPVVHFIDEWRKEVSFVMGNLPDGLTPRFSGGSTYADKGLLTTIPDKMSSTPTIYAGTRCILPLWGDTAWARALVRDRPWQSDPLTVRGNIFFTVPKDGVKHRGCCMEASIPITYQLAAGKVLKKRLLRIGVNTKTGQAYHQKRAKRASETGEDATVDMSNASDTVARVLVQLTLRSDWFELLSSLRATHTQIKGKWVRLEKFSSMGNGFTFELETVLFATLARTVIRLEGGDPGRVTCYGDDLIVPVQYYRQVMAALRFFGFTPNVKKTFGEGPFRESCGGDFFNGVPVRAHYIEELPDEPQQWISLANGLRRVAFAHPGSDHRWSLVRRAWFCALDAIPSHIRRLRGPPELGDVVIHDEPDKWSYAPPPKKPVKALRLKDEDNREITLCEPAHSSWEVKWIHAYVPVPSVLPWHHWNPAVQLASCTLGVPSSGVTPRDDVSGYRIAKIPVGVSSSWLPTPYIRR